MLRAQIRSYAPRSVPRNLRRRAVRIDESRVDMRALCRPQPLHAIGAHAVVAVTDALRKLRVIAADCRTLNNQKVVGTGAGLCERNHFAIAAHSCSTAPSELTLEKEVD